MTLLPRSVAPVTPGIRRSLPESGEEAESAIRSDSLSVDNEMWPTRESAAANLPAFWKTNWRVCVRARVPGSSFSSSR